MPRPASDLKHRIVDAARGRFLMEGVDGASLRKIAREAKTSIGMIYYYYPTKDDLFVAVVQDVYAGILSDVAAAIEAGGTVEEQVGRLYRRLARLSDVEFAVLRLILREALVSSSRLGRLADLFLRGHIPLALGMIAKGQATGELRADAPPLLLGVATIVLGVFPQIVRRRVGTLLPEGAIPDGEMLAARMAEVLLDGIRVSGSSVPSGSGGGSPGPRRPGTGRAG